MRTIRKNFILDTIIAEHLEELAFESRKSMTVLIHEMVEERYRKSKVKTRMRALSRMTNSASGLFTENISSSVIKKIK